MLGWKRRGGIGAGAALVGVMIVATLGGPAAADDGGASSETEAASLVYTPRRMGIGGGAGRSRVARRVGSGHSRRGVYRAPSVGRGRGTPFGTADRGRGSRRRISRW